MLLSIFSCAYWHYIEMLADDYVHHINYVISTCFMSTVFCLVIIEGLCFWMHAEFSILVH